MLRLYKAKMDGFTRFKNALHAVQMLASSELRSLTEVLEARFGSLLNFAHIYLIAEDDPRPLEKYDALSMIATVIFFGSDQTGTGLHNQQSFDGGETFVSALVYDLKVGVNAKTFKCFCCGFRIRSYLRSNYLFKKFKITTFSKIRKDRRGFLMSFAMDFLVFGKMVSRHIFVFNRFESSFKASPAVYVLPHFQYLLDLFSYGSQEKVNRHLGNAVIFFDCASRFSSLYSLYRYTYICVICDCLDDNTFSSIGSKIISLMGAVKNTEEMIEQMKLVYNKLRQEVITTELLEFGLHILLREKVIVASYGQSKRKEGVSPFEKVRQRLIGN